MPVWWKADRLYVLILDEVRALWGLLARAGPRHDQPPDGLRVEEHLTTGWDDLDAEPRPRHVWYLDDDGPRLVPGLRAEPFDPGATRGAFFQFGLIRFQITGDRAQVVLAARLGPLCTREVVFEIIGEGDAMALRASSGTLGTGGL
jgi:hypothetical protein